MRTDMIQTIEESLIIKFLVKKNLLFKVLDLDEHTSRKLILWLSCFIYNQVLNLEHYLAETQQKMMWPGNNMQPPSYH